MELLSEKLTLKQAQFAVYELARNFSYLPSERRIKRIRKVTDELDKAQLLREARYLKSKREHEEEQERIDYILGLRGHLGV